MRVFTLAAAFFACLTVSSSQAASLRVAPVLLDLKAPTAASSLRIWNDAKTPINVQVRIFRWTQKNGQDVYTAAQDVVASPPMTQLKGGAENLIRIVRLSKAPLRAEESYRVIVDELPPAGRPQSGTVNLVVRHSIPVFFSPASTGDAEPAWKITPGERRIRIANLMLSGGNGQAIARQQGLVGYVLGGSAASFVVPATGGKRGGGTLKISADSEGGPVNATARVSGG